MRISHQIYPLAGLLLMLTPARGNATVASAGSARKHLGGLVARVINGTRRQERLLKNIAIVAHSKLYSWNSKTGVLRLSDECRLKALYGPGGMCLIRVNPLVMAATNEPAPYVVMDFSVAFNGRVGMVYTRKSGSLGSLGKADTGTISGHIPRWAASLSVDSAWQDTIWGCVTRILHSQQMEPLSAWLAHLPAGAHVSYREQAGTGGRKFIDVSIGYIDEHVFRLDPRKGFALVRDTVYEAVPIRPGQRTVAKPIFLKGGKVSRRLQWAAIPTQIVNIKGFWHAAPGIYYPRLVQSTTFMPLVRANGPVNTLTVRITKATANQPGVGPGAFRLRFPRGCIVTDESTGRVIHVGGTPGQQVKAILRAVETARKEIATQPAVKGGRK